MHVGFGNSLCALDFQWEPQIFGRMNFHNKRKLDFDARAWKMVDSAISQPSEDQSESEGEHAQPLVAFDANKHAASSIESAGGVQGNALENVNADSLKSVLPMWVSGNSSGLSLDPLCHHALFGPFISNAPTHNLIPPHLQADAIATTLNGTPGYQPALISTGLVNPALVEQAHALAAVASIFPFGSPALTVQDRHMVPPVFNGVNPMYPGLRLLNANPPIFAVDNFLTPFECQFLIQSATDCLGPAPVVGKGAGELSPSRTSSTCYLAREDLPDYLRKVSLLTGKPVEHCELPQVGRYHPSEQYLQHFDAFDLSNEDGRRFAANGGQRTVTVLVYLNDVIQGGATAFPAINLEVQPRQGMAVVFFPATVDGLLDKMALHAALPAVDTKFVSQVWIRQGEYRGQPSKRLPQTLGLPFGQPPPPPIMTMAAPGF
jgi:prolyl 4-hydroxylase